ncbi:MAG: hypothetical protein ABSH50_18195 [Bryobacteraceae bacterium]
MEAFWADAERLFDTACRAGQTGSPDCDLAILIGAQGGIHILEAGEWALPGLLAHHGAQTGYRITRRQGSVKLEGRCGSTACQMLADSPAHTARQLLSPIAPGYLRGNPAAALLCQPDREP